MERTLLSQFSCLEAQDAQRLRSGMHSMVLLPLVALTLHNWGCCTKESDNWCRLLLLLHRGRIKADSHVWGIRAPFLLCDLTNHISNRRSAAVRALQTPVFYKVPLKVVFCQCKNKADFIYRVQ